MPDLLDYLGKGFVLSTSRSSTCWCCGQLTNLLKPGINFDTWLCKPCDITWTMPVLMR